MATSLNEQTKDLSSCCVCYDTFDGKTLKPKYLSCSHTFCPKCTKEMADVPPPGQVTCPFCDKVCTIPAEGSDSLPNNLHALHIVKLKKGLTERDNTITERDNTIVGHEDTIATLNNILNHGQLWCVTCKGLAKPKCHEGENKHKLADFGEDVEEFNGWLVEWETDANQGIGKVDHGQGHLKQEKEQPMAKVKAVEVKMEEGVELRQKLVEILANCEKMKQLPPESKASVFMRKNLRQAIEDTKQEVQRAEEFVNGLGIIAKEKKRKNDEVDVVASKKKKSLNTSINATAGASVSGFSRSVSSFRENCFAATRQQQSQFFVCRDLIGHTNSILAMEFSTEGSFIVSGSVDKTIRLWSLCDVPDVETQQTPTPVHEMKTKHESYVICVAISPDSSRIFSGAMDSKLFVHDARTGRLLNTVKHPQPIKHFTLQPGRTNGDVFVSSCDDGILRLFDLRQSVTVPAFESAKDDNNKIWGATFSPCDSMIIASPGPNDVKFFDIRQNSFRCAHTFISNFASSSKCVFNRQGTRLLVGRIKDSSLMVTEVSSLTGGAAAALQNVRLSATGFHFPNTGRNKYCFAGRDDDLVVSASSDHNLYVWSLPESQGNDISVNESLLVLRGHTKKVYAVRFDPCNDVLASAGLENIIKLWTPIVQQ